MVKIRAFSPKRKLKTIFRCISRQRSFPVANLQSSNCMFEFEPISKLIKWTRKIGSKAKSVCCGQRYVKMGQDPMVENDRPVPKGYIAVYVGPKESEFERVLVPVIYLNHPLFEQLLQKGEEKFGLDYPGAITIPCRISEFEHVQNQIKEGLRRY